LPRHRLGVVLLIPAPVAAEVDGLRRACGDRALERVPPHLTLVPPVNVNANDLDAAMNVVRSAAGASQLLKLFLGPAATFLPDTPVLYLAVDGDLDGLGRLRDRIGIGPLDRPQTWPFVPHVTLADGMEPFRAEAAVAAMAGYRASVTIEKVHVLEEGPDRFWRPLADVALTAPSIVGRGGLPLELAVTERLDPEAERFYAEAWSPHLLESYGVGGAAPVPFAITARREGAVVGVALGFTDDELCLERLVVASGERRQGIGSHLLAAVEHLGAERGCRRMLLVVRAGTAAEGFHRVHGWHVDQTLPRWRHERDFVRLSRRLPGGDEQGRLAQ
jgi:2'-5' RNA ligase